MVRTVTLRHCDTTNVVGQNEGAHAKSSRNRVHRYTHAGSNKAPLLRRKGFVMNKFAAGLSLIVVGFLSIGIADARGAGGGGGGGHVGGGFTRSGGFRGGSAIGGTYHGDAGNHGYGGYHMHGGYHVYGGYHGCSGWCGGVGVYLGWPYGWGWPYYYSGDYPNTYYYPDYPPGQPSAGIWYRCDDPQGYYPYVPVCNRPWEIIPTSP